MSTLHEIATSQYTEHYASMNPTLDATQMPKRFYRNLELMYGPLVNGLASGQAVADIGCGAGFLLHWLADKPGLDIFGVDASAGQVALSRRAAPDADIVCADALSFFRSRPRTFGGIFCIDMLEHIQTDHEVLELLSVVREALEPGGFLICRVPNAAHVLGSYSRYIDITHHRGFTAPSLRQAFSAAGFENTRIIPARSSIWLGRLRLSLEHTFHRALFLLGGFPQEKIFSQNIVLVGFKS
jgi:cyclopropane fatty-acyl-phospholipid synthase-like methyltransferase